MIWTKEKPGLRCWCKWESCRRQVLEGAKLAPGNQTTLNSLERSCTEAVTREALPPDIHVNTPDAPFDLDKHIFNSNLRSSRRGAARGPSGMTTKHLRPFVGRHEVLALVYPRVREVGTCANSRRVVDLLRLGKITALSKPDNGVRCEDS